MRKRFKGYLAIVSMLVFLLSCKLYERKKVIAQQSEISKGLGMVRENQHNILLWDSFSHDWLFFTDSSFRFHPDSGLVGNGGLLRWKQSASKIQQLRQKGKDSVWVNNTHVASSQESQNSVVDFRLIGISICLVGALIYFSKRID